MRKERYEDIKNLVDRFGIYLPESHPGCIAIHNRPKKQSDIDFLKSHKSEIIEYLSEEARKDEERKAKIAAIPGLADLKKRRMEFSCDMAKYAAEKEAYFEGRGSYPVFPKEPDPSKYQIEELRKKYPQADAYLKAEAMKHSSNYELSKAGKKILEEVIDGNWKNVNEKIEKAKNEFAMTHTWD